MFKYFAKKYAVRCVNDIIKTIQKKCDIDKWHAKITKIVAFLQKVLKTLDDKVITDEEAEIIVDETKKLFD